MLGEIDKALNMLGRFCGIRDVSALTKENLKKELGIEQADVMVLFGGSIYCGGDVLAEAINNNIAQTYIVVGGEGHTTQNLRDKIHELYPEFVTEGLSEAETFQGYLKRKHQIEVDYIETRSTNCGNNITRLLEILEKENITCNTIILSQDATMQRRMSAALEKYRPDMKIINYATYSVRVVEVNGQLEYDEEVDGMWEVERYASLLMGEVPRLRDDKDGYGPNGENFIAHVEIPIMVEEAFAYIKNQNKELIRTANHQYKELLH